MRVDLTINIPTIMSMIGFAAGAGIFGINLYNEVKDRQVKTEYIVASLGQRVEKTELLITQVKTDQATQTATLKTEMKTDITEIKDLLNRLIFGGSAVAPNRQLKDWSK